LTSRSATIPTVGDAVQALDDLCTAIAGILKQITNLSVELASTDHGNVDSVPKVSLHDMSCIVLLMKRTHQTITLSDLSSLRELDAGQRRSVMFHELETVRESAREDVMTMLGMILRRILF
jgi:nuclear pore complex protein Nup205